MTRLPSYDFKDQELRARYSLGADESVIQGIITAFENLDVETTESERVIHDVIDSDALVRLHESGSGNVRVSFRMWEHTVVVESGHVLVYASSTRE